MSESVTLLAVGDNIPSREDYATLYRHAAPLLREADITFGQLETVLIDKSIEDLYPYVAAQARMPCSSDPGVAPGMKEAGFDVVSFASNHSMDYGRVHFLNTLRYLREAGLAAPPTVTLLSRLREAGLDVEADAFTADEAAKRIARAIRKKGGTSC